MGFNGSPPLPCPSALGRDLTSTARLILLAGTQIGACSSRSTFGAATTGERRPVAPASQPDGPSVQTAHDSSSLPLSFTPPILSVHRSHVWASHPLSRRVSTGSNASCQPHIGQGQPVVATIDCRASRTSIGGGDDEKSAPIDDRFDGLGRGVEAVAVPTAVDEAGALVWRETAWGWPGRPHRRTGWPEGGWGSARPRI